MMNMIDIQEKLKDFSEQQLAREMQAPTGIAPQFLVLSEMTRRKRMRDSMQPQDTGTTVAEEVVSAAGVPQGGIATMAQALAPKSSMAQNTGASPMPVLGMYGGGYVQKMQDGGIASLMANPAARAYAEREAQRLGMTLEQYLQTAGSSPFTNQNLTQFADRQADRNRMLGLEPVGDSVTFPTQMDLNRRFTEDKYAINTRPMTPPQPDVMPTIPSDPIGRVIGSYGIPAMDAPQAPDTLVDLDLTTPEQPTAYDDLMQRVWESTGPGAGLGGPNVTPQAQRVEPRPVSPIAEEAPLPSPDMYPTDLSWIGDMASGAASSVGDFLSTFSGVPEGFATPPGRGDRDQQGTMAPPAAGAEEAAPAETAPPETNPPVTTTPSVETAVSGGSGGSGSGIAAAVGAAPMTSYEQELMDAMKRAERRAEQDKWLSLAQVGLNLMSSKQPTLGGAIGEAGMAGLGAFQQARNTAEEERLGLSKALYDIQASREAAMAAQRAAGARAAAAGLPKLSELEDYYKALTVETKAYDDQGNEITKRVARNPEDAGTVAQIEDAMTRMAISRVAPMM